MKLGQYIVKRLEELHVTHVFGLPGDYNMQLLDHIEDSHKLQWVGCANELLRTPLMAMQEPRIVLPCLSRHLVWESSQH